MSRPPSYPETADAAAGRSPRVSVVVVNWNGAAYLGACLESVRGGDREALVVDNASTDSSRDLVQRDFPWVRWLASPANQGFARAANQGLRQARGRFVLFLNPDARATEEAIAAALRTLEDDPSIGLVAVANRDRSGELTPIVESFFSLRTLVRARWAGRAWLPRGAGPVAVDWCHGAFFLGRRDELLALGGYDERFFLYAEDMDLCFRVQESGRSVVYLPQVSIEHEGNRAGEVLLGDRRAEAIFAGCLRFHALHHGHLAHLGLRIAALAFFLLRGAWHGIGGWSRASRDLALAGVALRGPDGEPVAASAAAAAATRLGTGAR